MNVDFVCSVYLVLWYWKMSDKIWCVDDYLGILYFLLVLVFEVMGVNFFYGVNYVLVGVGILEDMGLIFVCSKK